LRAAVEHCQAGDAPGEPLQIATWLQVCHDAGIAVRIQIKESATPKDGTMNGTAPGDRTSTLHRQLDVALQAGLNEEVRQAALAPMH